MRSGVRTLHLRCSIHYPHTPLISAAFHCIAQLHMTPEKDTSSSSSARQNIRILYVSKCKTYLQISKTNMMNNTHGNLLDRCASAEQWTCILKARCMWKPARQSSEVWNGKLRWGVFGWNPAPVIICIRQVWCGNWVGHPSSWKTHHRFRPDKWNMAPQSNGNPHKLSQVKDMHIWYLGWLLVLCFWLLVNL